MAEEAIMGNGAEKDRKKRTYAITIENLDTIREIIKQHPPRRYT